MNIEGPKKFAFESINQFGRLSKKYNNIHLLLFNKTDMSNCNSQGKNFNANLNILLRLKDITYYIISKLLK